MAAAVVSEGCLAAAPLRTGVRGPTLGPLSLRFLEVGLIGPVLEQGLSLVLKSLDFAPLGALAGWATA